MRPPEIMVMEDSINQKIIMRTHFDGETQIDKMKFFEVMKSLGINSMEECMSRIDVVIRHFIKESEYVEFEEINE
jgi:hypothetical protein